MTQYEDNRIWRGIGWAFGFSTPLWVALVLLLIVWCTSCIATSADLERIANKQAEGEARIAAAMAEYQAGVMPFKDVVAEIEDAWGATGKEIGEVAEEIKDRAEGSLQVTLESILLALGGLGVPVAAGVNYMRNRSLPGTRRKPTPPPKVT